MLVLTLVFAALGTWQVQRLFWKLDLIARVDARVHAGPVPSPAQGEWGGISAEKDEYRHVTATGTFEHGKSVLVQAVTERGAGYWLLTPLLLSDSSVVLVNRGFLPEAGRNSAARTASEIVAGPVTVTGLLRISEPGGAFLRSNDPANDRWYSRDVDAIARSKGFAPTAPYFIDADATPNPGGLPIGGLTVVQFRNSHLVYAATWYALAIMTAAALTILRRRRLI
ncbi:SURF1 family protein [Rhizobium sp. Root483D2]|uniref:SURF1 family protein n=1 Tax=Rhizobium sp. Root483D2 TaxID=1736545 RepID=UPI0009EA9226|nr:SURF1 family protein [Rhizobium sp. Root483D2]